MKPRAPLALLLLFCILLPALAQTMPAPPPVPQKTDDKDDVIRITTNLVQVDAVVTKDGKPVTNLTADDFEIYQDGKKQTITSFAYISNVTAANAQPAARVKEKGREVAPPVGPIKPDEPHRTIAFVVDDLGISGESMGHIRHQLRKFIAEQLQPNDLVAIIRTGGWVGALQQFTNDRRLLNHAVDKLKWNHCSRVGIFLFRPTGGIFDDSPSACSETAYDSTIGALRFIVDAMGELPGRKSMVLLSDSLPIESQEWGFRAGSALAGSSLSGSSDGPGRMTNSVFDSMDNSALLRAVAEKAIRSSVVIYSVDTQGLAVTGPFASDSLALNNPLHGNPRDFTRQLNAMLASRSNQLWTRRGGGELLARQTGGFQVRNSNDFQLKRIVEDQSGYYLIGYRPSEETFNKRFHQIKAKVKQSGMTLRTRFGFVGVTEEQAKQARTIRDLTNLALVSPFRAQDINVDMSSFFVHDKAAGSMVRSFVYIDSKDVQFTTQNDRQHASIELHSVLFGDNGTVVDQVTRNATLNLSQSEYEYALRNGMQVAFDMPVKRAGSYQLRIAALDKNSSRIGSAGQFVVVPDLSKKKSAVSGIVLGTARDNTGLGLANPGARRFGPNSEVHFAYMLYNALKEKGVARNLIMRAALFREGKNVYSAPEVPVGLDKGDPNRVVVTGSVKLAADLQPGSYYLQIVVKEADPKSKSAPVVQWIEFEIETS